MTTQINRDNAKKFLESAFMPIHCKAKYSTDQMYVTFQLKDANGKLLGPEKKQLTKVFCSPRRLKFWVVQIRKQLRKQGVTFSISDEEVSKNINNLS